MKTNDMGGLSDRAVRLRHYQGERLLAGDFQDEYDNLTWLRELHVIALHDTWGIALGYDVQYGSADYVLVGPGLAYDAKGNEIVLAHSQPVHGPQAFSSGSSADGDYELVMRYDAGLGERAAGAEAALCAGSARREAPALIWRRKGETQLGLDVPLIGASVAGGKLDQGSFDYLVRRYAQPLLRPHIASGLTPREQSWQFWEPDDRIIGYRTTVDTSEAGFVGTPFYLASLRLGGDTLSTFVLEQFIRKPFFFFLSVSKPTPTSFEAQLTVAEEAEQVVIEAMSTSASAQGGFQVSWFGVEPVGGCTPVSNFQFLEAWIIDFLPPFFVSNVTPIS